MRLSPRIPRPPRQRCPGLPWGTRVLVGLALLLGGCLPEDYGCVNSTNCGPGLTCMYWNNQFSYCVQACPVEDDFCADGRYCTCSDSPAKTRCLNEFGERIGVCEISP
jgi:hypothetical protein